MDNLFNNKRNYITNDGDELVNMCIPSIELEKVNANAFFKLNSSYNGRLDRFVYDNISPNLDDGLDLTMYCNHIFNPFAVQENDILYAPIVDDNVYNKQSEPILPDGKKLSSQQTGQKQMSYAERVEYYAKIGLGIS